jgi:hyperosmotically inducible protein
MIIRTLALAALLCGSWAVQAQEPDNTKTNKDNQPTADKQKMNASDRDVTAKIRRSIMDDKTLSTYAHNVKIITQNGVVTVKGPVRSDDEKKTIVTKAVEVVGSADKVTDEITVKP